MTDEIKYKYIAFNWCTTFGMFGAHRFYMRKYITAILMLLTLGGFGIWWLIDFVRIAYDKVEYKKGVKLKMVEGDKPISFFERLAAHYYDIMHVTVLTLLSCLGLFILFGLYHYSHGDFALAFANITHENAEGESTANAISNIIYYIAALLYYTIHTASKKRTTYGKKLFGLVVVEKKSSSRISYLRSFWRCICYIFSYATLLIGFIMMQANKDRRCLHDYMAGTIVVRNKS